MKKLDFCTPEIFDIGINRLKEKLGFERGDGIKVTAEQGKRLGLSLNEEKAVIYYQEKHQFWRELGLLIEHLKKSEEVDISEDGFFSTLGVMIDASRCAVPTCQTVFELLDYLAVMGYSMMMLYTEDTVELENYPYFGYMRGRYLPDEIRAIDDYANDYGIEVVPCIECYGHMGKYLLWDAASRVKDTAEVLLAREEKTYALIEELIATVSSCVRSKRIHIGMDEAWDMGRGKFLDIYGYVEPIDIFSEHMKRLVEITDKYGLSPMMWSDMYFRVHDPKHWYYGKNTQISEETKSQIPENMQLVFWHYGEEPLCDDYMLKKHIELERSVMFAGSTWSWIGHFPEHDYMMETTEFSMKACRNNNVCEMMTALWFNDNAECDLFTNLFGLSYTAELAYKKELTKETAKARFEATTGGNYKAFYNMCRYHDTPHERQPSSVYFGERFKGKPLFWQDVLEGMYDTYLFEKPMSKHYSYYAKKFEEVPQDRWSDLYAYANKVFEYLALKCEIAEKLVPSYKSGDKERLTDIAYRLLPQLKNSIQEVHNAHRLLWHNRNKPFGWCNMDVRYAGVAARCDTAIMRLDAYINGQLKELTELDEIRLKKGLSGFVKYSGIANPIGTT